MDKHFKRTLLKAASEPYRHAGLFAWFFAKGKLGGDPVFTHMLAKRLIADDARIVDIGCGQGLLAAWLQAADALNQQGKWPADLPAPPRRPRVRGIELMPADVERARNALGDAAQFVCGDMCSTDFGAAEVVVILDVLHYVDYAAQDAVLARVRDSLRGGGRLLLRVGDAAAGLPFKISNWNDRAILLGRGHGWCHLYCRPLTDWIARLESLGFVVTSQPMSDGTPFANVLLVGEVL